MSEQFLSPIDPAIRLALHAQTLTTWRSLRRGPPFVKLGKTVRYAMSDVLEFERNGLRKPVPAIEDPQFQACLPTRIEGVLDPCLDPLDPPPDPPEVTPPNGTREARCVPAD